MTGQQSRIQTCVTCNAEITDGRACIMFPFGVAACNDACSRTVPPADRFHSEWDGTEWLWTGNHEGADDAIAASGGDPENAEARIVMAGIAPTGPNGEEGPWLAVGEGHFRFWEVSWP